MRFLLLKLQEIGPDLTSETVWENRCESGFKLRENFPLAIIFTAVCKLRNYRCVHKYVFT